MSNGVTFRTIHMDDVCSLRWASCLPSNKMPLTNIEDSSIRYSQFDGNNSTNCILIVYNFGSPFMSMGEWHRCLGGHSSPNDFRDGFDGGDDAGDGATSDGGNVCLWFSSDLLLSYAVCLITEFSAMLYHNMVERVDACISPTWTICVSYIVQYLYNT